MIEAKKRLTKNDIRTGQRYIARNGSIISILCVKEDVVQFIAHKATSYMTSKETNVQQRKINDFLKNYALIHDPALETELFYRYMESRITNPDQHFYAFEHFPEFMATPRGYSANIDEILPDYQGDGLCAVCGKYTMLTLDHDHITGLIRGALCKNCNQGESVDLPSKSFWTPWRCGYSQYEQLSLIHMYRPKNFAQELIDFQNKFGLNASQAQHLLKQMHQLIQNIRNPQGNNQAKEQLIELFGYAFNGRRALKKNKTK